MLQPETVQDLRHQTVARAVQRRIDDFQRIGNRRDTVRVNGGRKHGGKILFIKVFTEHMHNPRGDGGVERHTLRSGQNVDLLSRLGDDLRLLGRDLGAVLPVGFIAVVLFRVMRCRDVDTGDATEFPHGEREFRRRADAVEEVDGDPVPCQHLRRGSGEESGIVTGVIRDCDPAGVRPLALDQLGNRLRRLRDGKDVHAPGTHIHRGTQTRCAEVHFHAETKFQNILFIADLCHFRHLCFVQKTGRKPSVILGTVRSHSLYPPYYLY